MSYTTLLHTPPAVKPGHRRRHPVVIVLALVLFGVALVLALVGR